MPELRSGARRSKRHGDLQPSPQPINQVENLALPAQNRTMSGYGSKEILFIAMLQFQFQASSSSSRV
ncbi:hypothetical protein CsSME_00026966 [Camellia sinensis var. sinensis]